MCLPISCSLCAGSMLYNKSLINCFFGKDFGRLVPGQSQESLLLSSPDEESGKLLKNVEKLSASSKIESFPALWTLRNGRSMKISSFLLIGSVVNTFRPGIQDALILTLSRGSGLARLSSDST